MGRIIGQKILTLLLIIICVILMVSACNKAETDFEEYFASVFILSCDSESRLESIGTAFKLYSGEIITNAHIVSYKEYGEHKEYENIFIKLYKTAETIKLRIKAIDNEKDIAILELAEETILYNKIKGLKVGQVEKLKIGDTVYTIGNLNNYGLCLNKGIISAREKQIENNGILNTYLQSDIEISKGNSGGPVLNSKGEIVGVMTLKLRDTNFEYVDGASFFIPINAIEKLL